MSILYILCGLVGSGKSTWALNNSGIDKNTYIVSRDSIRKMLLGGIYKYDGNLEPIVRDIARSNIIHLLREGHNVVVDETCLTVAKRKELIDIAMSWDILGENSTPIIVWCKEDECNLQNRMNDDDRGYSREQWKSVIEGMKKTFEPPTGNECDIIEVKPW